MDSKRLDSYLAQHGLCARRKVSEFLRTHTVTINGERAHESGIRIDQSKDQIAVDGKKVSQESLVYFAVHKPKGIISTVSDEYGRKNITSIVPYTGKLYPVGRLDKETTGLILLTNDGDLAYTLTHPRFHIEKVYEAKIAGSLSEKQRTNLEKGIQLKDGKTAPAKVRITAHRKKYSWIEITIHEGKNRQIRRMLEAVRVPLIHLQRVQIGPISLDSLAEGTYRPLASREVSQLHKISSQVK